MPALLVYVIGVPSNEPLHALLNGWENEPFFFVPAAIYTAMQVAHQFT